MQENICKFVPTNNASENITILNFVYEKIAEFKCEFITSASHAIYIVTCGNGILHTTYGDFEIKEGDIFFTFSSKPYFIEKKDDLNYIYISFVGLRASGLFSRLHIQYNKPVYSGYSDLIDRWKEAFENTNLYNIDLTCEGLLLCTLSILCKTSREEKQSDFSNNIIVIKQYVDMHYTDAELNLENISKRFNYNYKYLSHSFKKMMKISFSEYITFLRLDHAKTLMDNGLTSVQEIAFSSGYKDPLYFSTVFKIKNGISPKAYIMNRVNK